MTPSQLRQTHTVVTLGLSKAAFAEISAKLRAAGYDHAFMLEGEVDMSGIAVALDPDAAPRQNVTIDVVPQGYRAVPIKKLVKIASLIDPEPIEVDGKWMVFRNPMAAEVLTRLSAEIRELMNDRATADLGESKP